MDRADQEIAKVFSRDFHLAQLVPSRPDQRVIPTLPILCLIDSPKLALTARKPG
jgi:hypothetical protein